MFDGDPLFLSKLQLQREENDTVMTTNLIDKLPVEYENPFDAILLSFTAILLPLFRRTGHTPNVLTTYSFVCCLISRWFLWKDHIATFFVFHHLGYLFDCMDGQMARRYNMTSRFGDLYDHSTDIIGDILLGIIVWLKYRHVIRAGHVALVLVLLAMLPVAIGCQQLYYRPRRAMDEGDESLDKCICLCQTGESIRWTRFFGVGTWQLVTSIVVVHLHLLANPIVVGPQSRDDWPVVGRSRGRG
jgi:phosphatidylglycerophosphate synthase